MNVKFVAYMSCIGFALYVSLPPEKHIADFLEGLLLGYLVASIAARAALTRKDNEYRQFFSDVIERIDDSR